jgi:hypothetical protein
VESLPDFEVAAVIVRVRKGVGSLFLNAGGVIAIVSGHKGSILLLTVQLAVG